MNPGADTTWAASLAERWEREIAVMKEERPKLPDIHTRTQATYEIVTKEACLRDLRTELERVSSGEGAV